MSDDEAGECSFFGDVFSCEGKQWNVYVGIEVVLIGMTVMFIVLVHPPAVAHADEQIACEKADEVVFPRFLENLAVAGLVTEESKLCGDKGQKDCIEQLQPENVDENQERNTYCQEAQQKDDLEGIVHSLLFQQPVLLHQVFEFGVFTRRLRGGVYGVCTRHSVNHERDSLRNRQRGARWK